VAACAVVGALIAGDAYLVSMIPHGVATADSQSPGIYATSFYSRTAGAQVVWLDGMEPASDRPTYLDPTTDPAKQDATSAEDPNSL
jgi:hypothetical protein